MVKYIHIHNSVYRVVPDKNQVEEVATNTLIFKYLN